MKVLIALLSGWLLAVEMGAQSIDLAEAVPGPPFFHARNGFVSSADIDGDGDADVLMSGQDVDAAELKSIMYINDGNGNFAALAGTPFPGLQFGCSGFADIDNDGDPDLLITGSNFSPKSFADLYSNDGSGNFSRVPNTPFQPVTEGALEFADVDGDGDLDLFLTGYVADTERGFTQLYLNDGSGGYAESPGAAFDQLKFSSVKAIDVDGDLDRDVIIAGSDDNDSLTTRLYLNDGSGAFSPAGDAPFAGIQAGDIAVGDVDNDGDEDVLLVGSHMAELYLNNGAGDFTAKPGLPFTGTFLGTADFADLDLDGDLDVLVTGAVQGAAFAAHVYANLGDNHFVLADSLVDAYLTSTVITDIDGDADPDVVIVGITNEVESFKPRTYINRLQLLGGQVSALASDVSVFPNPSRGRVDIQSKGEVLRTVEIFDLMGRRVLRVLPDRTAFTADLSGLPAGGYVLLIRLDDNSRILEKIIKE